VKAIQVLGGGVSLYCRRKSWREETTRKT